MKPPFRHLKRRRLLIWALALLLIAAFGSAIGGIFWSVRMKTDYRAELVPAGEGIFSTSVPRLPFQIFRAGEPASLRLSDGVEVIGTLRAAYTGTESMELRLEFSVLPPEPAAGELTIRSQRLLAAFLSPVSPRLGN